MSIESRDAAIFDRHVHGGESLSAIAPEYGISRQRAQQIMAEHGWPNLTEQRRAWLAGWRRIAKAVDLVARAESRPGARHGTRARYDRGCHCRRCRAANATYHRNRYQARKRGDA